MKQHFTILLILLIVSISAQSPEAFDTDKINVAPGMLFVYETSLSFFNLGSGATIDENQVFEGNETQEILAVNYSTGIITVKHTWFIVNQFGQTIHRSIDRSFNISMDQFEDSVAIFTDWGFWKKNITDVLKAKADSIQPEVEFSSKIVDNQKHFGYETSEYSELNQFGRSKKITKHREILYTKSTGVKAEWHYLDIEEGPNGIIDFYESIGSLVNDSEDEPQLDTKGIIIISSVVLLIIMAIYLARKILENKSLSRID